MSVMDRSKIWSAIQSVSIMNPGFSRVGKNKARDRSSRGLSKSHHVMDMLKEIAMDS